MSKYRIYLENESGEEEVLEFEGHEYRSLMELVYNELYEDWGDCRGQAMCGTCHIEILEGETGEVESYEELTLEGLPNKTPTSRLSCQMSLDSALHNLRFRILKDY